MAKVEIYTTAYCPYCLKAKALLDAKGVAYTEISLEGKPDDLAALKKRTGWRTVPQIFIDGKLIGGFTDLAEMESNGKLDQALGG